MEFFGNIYAIFVASFAYALLLLLALGVGVGLAFAYKVTKKGYSSPRFFPVALALIPLAVALVAGLVVILDDELGWVSAVGAALLGAALLAVPLAKARHFDLLDRLYLLWGFVLGLVLGFGYAAYGVLAGGVLIGLFFLFHALKFGEGDDGTLLVRIKASSDLSSSNLLDPLFDKRCASFHLLKAEAVEGTDFFFLTYVIALRKGEAAKALIEELKEKNGNLPIVVTTGLLR
jgi:hypothetical protein